MKRKNLWKKFWKYLNFIQKLYGYQTDLWQTEIQLQVIESVAIVYINKWKFNTWNPSPYSLNLDVNNWLTNEKIVFVVFILFLLFL